MKQINNENKMVRIPVGTGSVGRYSLPPSLIGLFSSGVGWGRGVRLRKGAGAPQCATVQWKSSLNEVVNCPGSSQPASGGLSSAALGNSTESSGSLMNLADDKSTRGMALEKRGGETGVSAEESWGCVSLTARRIWDRICSLAYSCALF